MRSMMMLVMVLGLAGCATLRGLIDTAGGSGATTTSTSTTTSTTLPPVTERRGG